MTITKKKKKTSIAKPQVALDLNQLRKSVQTALQVKGISINTAAAEAQMSVPTVSQFLRGSKISLNSATQLLEWLGGSVAVETKAPVVLQTFKAGGKTFVIEIREVKE